MAAPLQPDVRLRHSSSPCNWLLHFTRSRHAKPAQRKSYCSPSEAAGVQRKRSDTAEPCLMCEGLARTHDGMRMLFEGLTFTLHRGERMALVGANGAGKTSLLRVLSGEDQPDGGNIVRRRGLSIGWLAQSPSFPPGTNISQAVLQSGSTAARAVLEYERCAADPVGSGKQAMERALDAMNALDAWDLQADAQHMLAGLGIHDPSQPILALSGGQQRRVALAAALATRPDVLILDEPTNHLDLGAISWLEKRLNAPETTLLLVTHDRFFMEQTCTSILELEDGKAHVHNIGGPGSWQRLCELRAERRAMQASMAAAAQQQLKHEAEWMRKQPRARSVKAKFRIDNYYRLCTKARSAPKAEKAVDFGAAGSQRQGRKVLIFEEAACSSAGVPTIRDFWYDFARGERIGVVGPNGAGKTTLMNMIAGQEPLTAGSRDPGETTTVGFLTQHMPPIKGDLVILDYLREMADSSKDRPRMLGTMDQPEILLERLGFRRPRQHQLVSSLSGGEVRRLQMAAVLIARPNVLIMDEPTNDLDLQTIESLEGLLDAFSGVLLVVSHDRMFVNNAVDKLFVVEGDGLVRLFEGQYSEYLQALGEMEKVAGQPQHASNGSGRGSASHDSPAPADSNGSQASSGAGATASKNLKMGFRERQEFAGLEGHIERLTAEKAGLERQLAGLPTNDAAKLEGISVKLAKLSAQIDTKTDRWLELAELDETAR